MAIEGVAKANGDGGHHYQLYWCAFLLLRPYPSSCERASQAPSSCNRWAAATAGHAQTSVQHSRLTWRRSANTLQWEMSRFAMCLRLVFRGCTRLIWAISAHGPTWHSCIRTGTDLSSYSRVSSRFRTHTWQWMPTWMASSCRITVRPWPAARQRSPTLMQIHLMHHTLLLMAVNNATLRCRSMASREALSLAVPLNVIEKYKLCKKLIS